MPIAGPAIAKFNNGVPIGLNGSWNVTVGSSVFRSNGQGTQDPTTGQLVPGSGYQGSSIGSAMSVTGSFEFVVDSDGTNVKDTINLGVKGLFSLSWPNGDPLLGAAAFTAVDCHFDNLSWDQDHPGGKQTIRGTMSAGKVTGPGFTQA